ncbi:hypothetical protein KR222_002115, partial [Zaprionus bogoriensis]
SLPHDHINANQSEAKATEASDKSNVFPFVVSIQIYVSGKYQHLCGGSIISIRFVITAAHCTLKPRQLTAKDLIVVGGSNHLFDKESKRFRVKAMQKHPEFIPLKGHDILLLLLATEIAVDNVRFGVINFRNETRKQAGLNAWLLGWGRTKPNVRKALEVIPFRTIEDAVCFLDFRFKYLTGSEICAINSKGPRGACDGDSGAPLVDMEQQALYGLLSYGRQPCQIGKPYAFTRLSVYIKWIEREMANML